jgi:hypothetical protein
MIAAGILQAPDGQQQKGMVEEGEQRFGAQQGVGKQAGAETGG